MKALMFASIFLLTFSSFKSMAQIDSLQSLNLLDELNATSTDSVKLLPDRFVFTQRIMWGEKGLMRNFNAFELSPEERQKELKIRRTMLVGHQIMGFTTLGLMVAQGFVGSSLYNGNMDKKDVHEALAAGINIGYFTTASLSLFAPPKMLDERKGYSSIKLHKALAIVHLSGMIATDILAAQLESNPDLKPYHRAAAFTTFGAFAASMIVIKF
ncbi:MAG TPA: hypothetical protein VLQ91_14015 [Draconibacterium sp.]|nr:hypothetical protein [Draconibacterium sp.]